MMQYYHYLRDPITPSIDDGRNFQWWKNGEGTWEETLAHWLCEGKLSDKYFYGLISQGGNKDEPPSLVLPLERLFEDLEFLEDMAEEDAPDNVPSRCIKTGEVVCGFSDDSIRSLGSIMQQTRRNKLHVRIGTWSTEEEEEESLNWREFTNFVEAIESDGKTGQLNNAMLFMLTDNSTVEESIIRGKSPSKKITVLVVRIKRCQLKRNCETFVIHCSSKRMIAQGTGGVPRGAFSQGVLRGTSVIDCMPLNLSALERAPELRRWLDKWIPEGTLKLRPEQWFVEGYGIRF